MEDSKRWPEVSRLGARIVIELGLDDSVDTLGRWMSHRIAELMTRADESDVQEEKENAKRECATLILRVWRRRKYWMRGQPLDNLNTFLKQTAVPPPTLYKRDEMPDSLNWVDSLPIFMELHSREHQLVLDTAVAELNLKKEKTWLKDNPDRLSDQERDTISWLVTRQEALKADYYTLDRIKAPKFGTLPSKERSRMALKALGHIRAERGQLITALKKSQEPKPRVKRNRRVKT